MPGRPPGRRLHGPSASTFPVPYRRCGYRVGAMVPELPRIPPGCRVMGSCTVQWPYRLPEQEPEPLELPSALTTVTTLPYLQIKLEKLSSPQVEAAHLMPCNYDPDQLREEHLESHV